MSFLMPQTGATANSTARDEWNLFHFLSAANEDDLLRLMLGQMQEAMVQLDQDGRVIFANGPAVTLLGPAHLLQGRFWHQWLAPRWQAQIKQLMRRCQDKQLTLAPTEMTLQLGKGRSLPVSLSLSYLPAKSPSFVVTLQDLSASKAELDKLQQLASKDSLTGLANRRVFIEQLEQQWDKQTQKRHPISVVVIDVDYFKLFNDQYGHLEGDKCLQRIAAAIGLALPHPQCLAARYGGEEFTLVLPGCNGDMAWQVASVIRESINQLAFPELGAKVSVSQGIATEINGQFRTAGALLFAADTALYRAKAGGRNRVNAAG
ncbi:sensor domain-containing diguanylate cyclase [Gallaecimonas xiamenensis]|uniref:diguanylate cyclase n=1 Tax=Gallaecimonas xiamenensis 3-C-1 TaxID=745411 RepID=K2JTP7_9GAMM|nr:sensor domain-containing diguanylate cyclase [Gallaecimonas xiamenensis]EKE73749.1 diguanylate cyclase [Gallaecimonas xiamenensis 3-C-1]